MAMKRRNVLVGLSGLLAASTLPTQAAATDRSNRRTRENTSVDVEPDDINIHHADPDAGDYGTQFTYYSLEHDVDAVKIEHREPVRLGPEVKEINARVPNPIWFGITAPDDDGIQHRIVHKGEVTLNLKDRDGQWHGIRAQFNGRGELLNINGVTPDGQFSDTQERQSRFAIPSWVRQSIPL